MPPTIRDLLPDDLTALYLCPWSISLVNATSPANAFPAF